MTLAILVVDDSRMSRRLTIRALPSAWAVDVLQASDGREALDICRRVSVDLMFLDLTMPTMDGYQVLEALHAEALSFPVIVISADIQPRAEQRVRELGAKAFLRKPVNQDDVVRVLEECGLP